MSKLYFIFKDNAAGKMFMEVAEEDSDWTYQQLGGTSNCIGEFTNEQEALDFLEAERKATAEYAVYSTQDGYSSYVVKMNCASGSYQDNKIHSTDRFSKAFESEAEANKYAASIQQEPIYILRDMGTVQEFEGYYPAINHSISNFTVFIVSAVGIGELGYATGFSGNVKFSDRYSDEEESFIRVSGDISFNWYEPVERY